MEASLYKRGAKTSSYDIRELEAFRPASCAVADLPFHIRFLRALTLVLTQHCYVGFTDRAHSVACFFACPNTWLWYASLQTHNEVPHRPLNTPIAFLRGFHRVGPYNST